LAVEWIKKMVDINTEENHLRGAYSPFFYNKKKAHP
jgi:hypothetical protein